LATLPVRDGGIGYINPTSIDITACLTYLQRIQLSFKGIPTLSFDNTSSSEFLLTLKAMILKHILTPDYTKTPFIYWEHSMYPWLQKLCEFVANFINQ
jgi:hypothetical protein